MENNIKDEEMPLYIIDKINEIAYYSSLKVQIRLEQLTVQVLKKKYSEICNEIKSPIERILFCQLEYFKTILLDNKEYKIIIEPQKQIDKYRVDFSIVCKIKKKIREIIIECDSQQWHERSEKERRYEKERDRYFQKQNYVIFHYTGKQIQQDSFSIAMEVFSFLLGKEIILFNTPLVVENIYQNCQ